MSTVAPKRKPRKPSVLRRAARRIGTMLATAWFWLAVLCLAGASLVTASAAMLAGPGWAVLTAGLLCFTVAAILVRGLNG